MRVYVGVYRRGRGRGRVREGRKGDGEKERERRRGMGKRNAEEEGEREWGCIVRGGKVSIIIVACCEGNFFPIIPAFREEISCWLDPAFL